MHIVRRRLLSGMQNYNFALSNVFLCPEMCLYIIMLNVKIFRISRGFVMGRHYYGKYV